MTSRFAYLPKLALPVLFFGYALWTSGSFLLGAPTHSRELPVDTSSVLTGGFTAKLEHLYKESLPYRSASVDLLGAARYLVFGEGRKGVVVGSEGWLFSSEEFRTAANESQAVADVADYIAKVQAQLAAGGTELLVVPLPAKADLYREHVANTAMADQMADRYRQFRAALADQGVRSVDTRPALLAAKAEDQVFLRGDTHWTPEGARVVAAATSAAAGPTPAPVPYVIEEAEQRFVDGDLVKFIASPDYGAWLDLEPEQVRVLHASAAQPTDLSSLDLFGSSEAEVALVGTSYSANEIWSFNTLLQAAMEADIVNFAEEGHGPILPMRSFLSHQQSGETPPRLVIWEFPVRYVTDPQILSQAREQE